MELDSPTNMGLPTGPRRAVDRRGHTLDGRYRLTLSLAADHGVEVWAGEDVRLGREVVVKVCSRFEHGLAERLKSEARRLVRVPTGIAPVVFSEGAGHGVSYLAMEQVQGRTLSWTLAQQRDLEPRLQLAKCIAATVAHLHEAGVPHGHLDMDHVFVAEDERGGVRVHLLGFGGWSRRLATRRWEQDARAWDDARRSDLEGLGRILYCVLGGRTQEPVLPLLDCSELHGIEERAALCRVVDRANSKDAPDRYGSASALAEDLCRAIELLPASYEAGEIVGHRYRVLSLLERGGMGAVYEVEDVQQRLPGDLVLKIAAPREFTFDARRDCRLRFQIERRALEDLAGFDVPRIYDSGDCGGYPFLVMEKVEGVHLDAAVAMANRANHWPFVLQMFRDIARTLDAAHAKGIVHRDVKPDNILVHPKTNKVCVLDFGIAKAPDSKLTRGSAMGTWGFQSREHLAGATLPASDQWSLAACLYVSLSGRVPGEEALEPTLPTDLRQDQVVEFLLDDNEVLPLRALPGLEGVPAHVNAAVSRALSKSPGDRFSSCREFVDAMDDSRLRRLRARLGDLKRQAKRPQLMSLQERTILAVLLVGPWAWWAISQWQ